VCFYLHVSTYFDLHVEVTDTQRYYSCWRGVSLPLLGLASFHIPLILGAGYTFFQHHAGEPFLSACRSTAPILFSYACSMLLYVSPLPSYVWFNTQCVVLNLQAAFALVMILFQRLNATPKAKMDIFSEPDTSLDVSSVFHSPNTYKQVHITYEETRAGS
jgi:hypothetical protein